MFYGISLIRRGEIIIGCGFFFQPCIQKDNEATTPLLAFLHEVSILSAHFSVVFSLVYIVKYSKRPSPSNYLLSEVGSTSNTPKDACLHNGN